jgi:hypothetical protein
MKYVEHAFDLARSALPQHSTAQRGWRECPSAPTQGMGFVEQKSTCIKSI